MSLLHASQCHQQPWYRTCRVDGRRVLVFYEEHYNNVIMGTIASQIASLTTVCSTVYSDSDKKTHQSSASLAFVWGIHRVSIWWRHHEGCQQPAPSHVWQMKIILNNSTFVCLLNWIQPTNLALHFVMLRHTNNFTNLINIVRTASTGKGSTKYLR